MAYAAAPMKLVARGATMAWPRRPLIMGIVNLGADSFSGDGLEDLDAALAHARELMREGAEIIDVGAESARTNRVAMSVAEETERLLRFVKRWTAMAEGTPPDAQPAWLSINTRRPAVAQAVLAAGGDILNDLGGLPTAENARSCAETGAALLIMHTVGEPKVPHTHVRHRDVLATLEAFFREKIALAESAGLSREAILLDPGFDFAKQREDNLRLLRELHRLHRFERPLLLPVSRKTFIGEVTGIADPAARDAGTVACIVQGMLQGAAIFRVHNVRAAAQTIRMVEALEAV